jgi:hypothetical protein
MQVLVPDRIPEADERNPTTEAVVVISRLHPEIRTFGNDAGRYHP